MVKENENVTSEVKNGCFLEELNFKYLLNAIDHVKFQTSSECYQPFTSTPVHYSENMQQTIYLAPSSVTYLLSSTSSCLLMHSIYVQINGLKYSIDITKINFK